MRGFYFSSLKINNSMIVILLMMAHYLACLLISVPQFDNVQEDLDYPSPVSTSSIQQFFSTGYLNAFCYMLLSLLLGNYILKIYI